MAQRHRDDRHVARMNQLLSLNKGVQPLAAPFSPAAADVRFHMLRNLRRERLQAGSQVRYIWI